MSECYIGRMTTPNEYNEKDTVVCAVSDQCADLDATLTEWLKDGLLVQRVPTEWARKFLFTKEPSP